MQLAFEAFGGEATPGLSGKFLTLALLYGNIPEYVTRVSRSANYPGAFFGADVTSLGTNTCRRALGKTFRICTYKKGEGADNHLVNTLGLATPLFAGLR